MRAGRARAHGSEAQHRPGSRGYGGVIHQLLAADHLLVWVSHLRDTTGSANRPHCRTAGDGGWRNVAGKPVSAVCSQLPKWPSDSA